MSDTTKQASSAAAAAPAAPAASNWEALRSKLKSTNHARPDKKPGENREKKHHHGKNYRQSAPQHASSSAHALPSFGISTFKPSASAAAPSVSASAALGPSSVAASAAVIVATSQSQSQSQQNAGALSFGALSTLSIAKNLPAQSSSHNRGRPGHFSGGAAAPSGGSTPAALKAALGPFEALVISAEERRYVALDCEMVGVGEGGIRSALAQVVIVDWAGRVLYMRYVRAQEPVTDYRTHVSGIKPEHLAPGSAVDFPTVQREVAALVKGKIIVGHGLDNDLKCLMLSHPRRLIRDTAKYRPFCWVNKQGRHKPRRLKHLTQQHLGVVIQEGEHEPAEDARAALALYRAKRVEWEAELSGRPLPSVLAAAKEKEKAERKPKRGRSASAAPAASAPPSMFSSSSTAIGTGNGSSSCADASASASAGKRARTTGPEHEAASSDGAASAAAASSAGAGKPRQHDGLTSKQRWKVKHRAGKAGK